MKNTVNRNTDCPKIEKVNQDYSDIYYLRHEIKLVYDYLIKDFTGEFYYKVYVLLEEEKREVIFFVNEFKDKDLYFNKKMTVKSKYYLKLEYFEQLLNKKYGVKQCRYYVDELG